MRKKLEFQADRIEAVLALHKAPGRVTGGTVTPRWVSFQVLPAAHTKIGRIKALDEELATALGARDCRISRRGAALTVEIPRDDPQPVRLMPLLRQISAGRQPIPSFTAILGIAEDGAPLLIRLSSPDVAHILIAGTTGSGKTALLQTVILSLALCNPSDALHLVLVDPKGHALGLFAGLPHLARPVIQDTGEASEALRSLVRLMERRGGGTGDPAGHPEASRVVVAIDELADLLMVSGKAAQESLARLAQRGREAGIHLVAATQKPAASVLGPLIKANFPVRLVGRVTSADDARTAAGLSGSGAERLSGRGDFLAMAEGHITRFQAAYVSPAELRTIVAQWKRVQNVTM